MRQRYSKSGEMHEFLEAATPLASRKFVNTPKKVIVVCLLGYLAVQVERTSAATWDDYCNRNLTLGLPCYITYFKYSGPNFDYRQYTWTATSPGPMLRLTCGYVNLPQSNNCENSRLIVQLGNNIVRYHCGTDWFIEQSIGNRMSITLFETNNGNEFRCSILPIRPEDTDCTCGRRNPTRIVGGVETGVNEYPMMAGIGQVFRGSVDVYCGGTIISQKYVITAAHCLTRRDLKDLIILVGIHNITQGSTVTSYTQGFRVLKVKIHPRFNAGSNDNANDVAIVEINGTMKFSTGVGPVCLPFRYARDSFVGAIVTVLGWGLLEFGGEKAETLQKVDLKVIDSKNCTDVYKTDASKTLCTYTRGKDSCQMDSGGPCLGWDRSTDTQQLLGIITGGSGCANDEPGINQRVPAYFDWLLDNSLDVAYCIK